VSINPYTSLPTTSTCASLDVPKGSVPGETVEFKGDVTDGTVDALAVDLNDILSIFEIARTQLNITISYSGYATLDTQNITAIVWSDASDCSLLSESTLAIQNPVTYVNYTAASLTFIRDYVVMAVYVIGGTDAKVNINPGDGALSVPSCDVSASLSVLTYNVTYLKEGSFKITVFAYNLASNVTDSGIIGAVERIVDLAIFGNSTILTPPGSGTWRVVAGTDQLPLENIVCVWNMGTNYGDTAYNVTLLNSSTPHEITFSYGQEADVGTQTIHVNCSNALSSQNLSMDVTVVWDNVTLGELTCNSSTLWNHSITCELTVVRFGTGACFEWDMGDGKPLVYYQDGYCAGYVPTASPTYIQVGHSQNMNSSVDGRYAGPQVPTFVQRPGTPHRHHNYTTLHFYISKCSVVWCTTTMWCAWPLDEGRHLWATIHE